MIPQLSKKIYSPRHWQPNNKHKKTSSGNIYKKKKNSSKILKFFLIIFFGLAILGLISLFVILIIFSRNLPDPNQLLKRKLAQTTKIYDRTGKTLLYEIHGAQKRTLIKIESLPSCIKWATICAEDKTFYQHSGLNFKRMIKAAIVDIIKGRKAQGASTITQQLVKNAILTPEKKWSRKIKEIIITYNLEKKFSKDEILQMYFNEIPYGSNVYGIQAAAKYYFNKNAKDLTLAESAILAALPKAPTYFSPYGSHKDKLIERQQHILNTMYDQGYITKDELEQAKKQEIKFAKRKEKIIAPHFVMFVKQYLSEKYGEEMLEKGGLKIYTTLDLYKQKIAEQVLKDGIKKDKKYNAYNGALVAIDPKTGQILSMVGSKDYFAKPYPKGCKPGINCLFDPNVNATISPRQPGSSFKPFVYATAFKKGYTPKTILFDLVTNFSVQSKKTYIPHNYDSKEHGPVTIKQALANSLNIPAVKTLYLVGVNNVLDLADDLGYSTLKQRNRYGLSLVLGGGEVKLLEHTNAYSAFARDGILHKLTSILKIEDSNGRIIDEYKNNEKRVLNSKIAREINDILSDNKARALTFGLHNWLNLGNRPIAAKTGTTNDYRDGWTIGYTPSLVVGVWVGNNNNEKMKRGAAGGVVAAPIWHNFMKKVLGNSPIEYFKAPNETKTGKPMLDGNAIVKTTVVIDKASNKLATELTPKSYRQEKTFKQAHCILYYVDKNNPLGPVPKDPNKDPQFKQWESPVLKWVKKQNYNFEKIPSEKDDLHIKKNQPKLDIYYPNNDQNINSNILIPQIKASALRGISRVEYYIDGQLLSNINKYPWVAKIFLGYLENGYHSLKIIAYDDIDNSKEKTVNFNLKLNPNQKENQISLSWSNPINNSHFTKNDFPINLEVITFKPENIKQVKFYARESDGTILEIDSENNITQNNKIIGKWTQIPKLGEYILYAKAFDWNNNFVKTKEVKIKITK